MGTSRGETSNRSNEDVPAARARVRGPRARLLVLLMGLAAAALLWLPYLSWRAAEPREWGGLIMLWDTCGVAVAILVVAWILWALGRTRPLARACARALALGTGIGTIIFLMASYLIPGPGAA
jgi:hypothetical protein